MRRILIVLSMIFGLGCSYGPDTDAVVSESNSEVEEGGQVKNADRDTAQEYFGRLAKVQSVEEEKKLLAEFAAWLKKGGYAIRVEVKNGKHVLSCPYFPPDTPWTEHSFFEVNHLELLPRVDHGG